MKTSKTKTSKTSAPIVRKAKATSALWRNGHVFYDKETGAFLKAFEHKPYGSSTVYLRRILKWADEAGYIVCVGESCYGNPCVYIN